MHKNCAEKFFYEGVLRNGTIAEEELYVHTGFLLFFFFKIGVIRACSYADKNDAAAEIE